MTNGLVAVSLALDLVEYRQDTFDSGHHSNVSLACNCVLTFTQRPERREVNQTNFCMLKLGIDNEKERSAPNLMLVDLGKVLQESLKPACDLIHCPDIDKMQAIFRFLGAKDSAEDVFDLLFGRKHLELARYDSSRQRVFLAKATDGVAQFFRRRLLVLGCPPRDLLLAFL